MKKNTSPHPSISDGILKKFSELLFTNRELGIAHNPYDQELREMTSIEQGDLESLRQSLSERHSGKVGRLAKDDLRNAKNLAIVNVTLACRAAIRGGVMPEISFSLSDALIQDIEECTDTSAVNQLTTALKYQYARMVCDIQTSKKTAQRENYHVKRCKDYIFTHLHGKLTLTEISNALSLNASYLSNLFSSARGSPLPSLSRGRRSTWPKTSSCIPTTPTARSRLTWAIPPKATWAPNSKKRPI